MKANAVEILFSRGKGPLSTISMDWEHSVIYNGLGIEFSTAHGHETVVISWEESKIVKSIAVPVDADISILVGHDLPAIVFVFGTSKFKVCISMHSIFLSS